MLSQFVTDHGQRENQQEVIDTSRIREFMTMNPPTFTSSSVTDNLENMVDELQKVLEIMHIVYAKRVELAAYQLKRVTRILFDKWKRIRADSAPFVS